MKYTAYGNTGKQVSVVGFGGLRFDLKKSNEENAELLIHAYNKGINYFDTAPLYCDDRSEAIFGVAFKKLISQGKTDFFVSTKGKPTVFDTAEKSTQAVMASLERLGVSKIHFYHVWCLRNMEQYALAMRPGGQYEGLLACQEKGLIDHIVFSSHQSGDEVATVFNDKKFEGVTMGINLLNHAYRWDSVTYAGKMKYGVVAMNPLSGGSIPRHEKELAFLTDGIETATELALRFNIQHPAITVSLIGFGSTAEIDVACRIADNDKGFTDAELLAIQEKLGSNMNAVCTGCGYCKGCPAEINIPGYMLFYNEKQMFGKSDSEMIQEVYGLEYWNYTAGSAVTAGGCAGCGRCEEECTQHLPIMKRLKEIAAWEVQGEDIITV